MACVYAIEAYGLTRATLPRIVEDALRRGGPHRSADEPLQGRTARSRASIARRRGIRVAVEPELFDFIAEAMRYNRESDGAFDITVGPLMKAWGFFRGEGRMPSDDELAAAARATSAPRTSCLNPAEQDDRVRRAGRRARSRRHRQRLRGRSRRPRCSKQRQIAAALVSSGGSTIYGLGAPPGRDGWDVDDSGSDRCADRPRAPSRSKDRARLGRRQLGEIVRVRRRAILTHHGPAHRPAGAGRAERRGARRHRNRRRCAGRCAVRDGAAEQRARCLSSAFRAHRSVLPAGPGTRGIRRYRAALRSIVGVDAEPRQRTSRRCHLPRRNPASPIAGHVDARPVSGQVAAQRPSRFHPTPRPSAQRPVRMRSPKVSRPP